MGKRERSTGSGDGAASQAHPPQGSEEIGEGARAQLPPTDEAPRGALSPSDLAPAAEAPPPEVQIQQTITHAEDPDRVLFEPPYPRHPGPDKYTRDVLHPQWLSAGLRLCRVCGWVLIAATGKCGSDPRHPSVQPYTPKKGTTSNPHTLDFNDIDARLKSATSSTR